MTAREGLSEVGATTSFLNRICQRIITAIAKTITAIVGIRSFFIPTVTVISFDVRGFLSGIIRSVVGMPSSYFQVLIAIHLHFGIFPPCPFPSISESHG